MSFDLDVVLAAHGAGDSSAANALVRRSAQRLGDVLVGARVTEAFIDGAPSWDVALERADRPHRLVVPVLTSDGYYAARLRRACESSNTRTSASTIAAPIGTHPALIEAVVERVAIAAGGSGTRRRVLVVGHGTPKAASSRSSTRTLARAIARRTLLGTQTAYLDDAPTIAEAVERIDPLTALLVVTCLLGGGQHAAEDVRAQVLAATHRRGLPDQAVTFVEPMGELSELGDILERIVADTRRRPVLRVGARGSRLSRRQVEIVAERLATIGADVHFIPIETLGDRDRSRPISALGDDAFTAEIWAALQAGRIDLAVHSLKDLPLTPYPGIVDAAMMPRASAGEALVSRTGDRLSALPRGARIGTSCVRRAIQIRRLRPDLDPVPIRGDVPARIEAVDRGDVDAVVLATAGLERLQLTHRIAERFDLDAVTPAAGQGVIVAQCREDSPHLTLLESLDDTDTRRAVQAERAFSRAIQEYDGLVAGAFAHSTRGHVELHARLIDPSDGRAWDAGLRGSLPSELGRDAALFLLASRDAAQAGVRP